ncbi:MAG: hypothetical protein Q9M14_05850 [Mariprofundaceae bacterium]|nr:hypothetical protein [Mariprofundaceae bacterium]
MLRNSPDRSDDCVEDLFAMIDEGFVVNKAASKGAIVFVNNVG